MPDSNPVGNGLPSAWFNERRSYTLSGPSAKGIHRGHVDNLLVRLQTSSRIARAYGSIRVIVEAQYIACAPSVESLSMVIDGSFPGW